LLSERDANDNDNDNDEDVRWRLLVLFVVGIVGDDKKNADEDLVEGKEFTVVFTWVWTWTCTWSAETKAQEWQKWQRSSDDKKIDRRSLADNLVEYDGIVVVVVVDLVVVVVVVMVGFVVGFVLSCSVGAKVWISQ